MVTVNGGVSASVTAHGSIYMTVVVTTDVFVSPLVTAGCCIDGISVFMMETSDICLCPVRGD